MGLIMNKSDLDKKTIEMFFDDSRVRKYLVKKSKDRPIKFPWDTRSPRVYKYNDQYIKVYGLKRKFHFFTGQRYALLVKKSHEFLTKHNIKTITPNIYAVKGRYSMVGTKDVETLGLTLLSGTEAKTIKNSLIEIHDSLTKVRRYHGDNKSDNSVIDKKTNEVYLLDIDSVKAYPFTYFLKNKMKRKTLASLNRKIGELNKKLEMPEYECERV